MTQVTMCHWNRVITTFVMDNMHWNRVIMTLFMDNVSQGQSHYDMSYRQCATGTESL